MDFTYLWKNLKFYSSNAGLRLVGGINWRFIGQSSDLEFKNVRYKNVLVHIAKQRLMSELEGELHTLIPKFRKNEDDRLRNKVLEQQKANRQQLIKDKSDQSEPWGKVAVENGKTIIARDKYGTAVPESLMLYYTDTQTHQVEGLSDSEGNLVKGPFSTKVVCHIDLSPQVSMSSTKNIVMTQVQGRDYSRKELVSGGDLEFNVNGNIVSNKRGVYPADAVKKFIQVMQYNGILDVNYMLFGQLNITRVIIKSYSLQEPTYMNVQPYSFSCVAVEPDEDVKIQNDTISVLNKELELSPMNKWYKLVLDSKWSDWAQATVTAAANTATTAAVSDTALSLDKLAPNI